MWKNWNPFRRKKDDDYNGKSGVGKENSATPVIDGSSKEQKSKGTHGHNNDGTNRINSSEDRKASLSAFEEEESSPNSNTSMYGYNSQQSLRKQVMRNQSFRSRTGMGVKDQLDMSLPVLQETRHITRHLDSAVERISNKTFNGVHGPLLSSPIVPQIKRALESQASGSPNRLGHTRGKVVGRSASLNYGSTSSLSRSSAGQVPWVRLKRRESIGLSDLVTGNTPQSPNTVKLAAPDIRHLPAPPSFKTTPVIVTTEPSRSRIVDTQTVVSALREKRKRFCGSQQEDFGNEDSWQSSVKRRRQDSSQSNASSVSVPPMPDSLPDLTGQPSATLLHMENLSSQRPSTIPSTVDSYMSSSTPTVVTGISDRSSHFMGLGGVGFGGMESSVRSSPNISILPPSQLPPPPFVGYLPTQFSQQQPRQGQTQYVAASGGANQNVNNSKSVLRSIQSSLSSSMRARVNASTLHQHGVDLKRIRGSKGDNAQRLSFSSDVSMGGQSTSEEPVQKVSKPTPQPVEKTNQEHQQNQSTSAADRPAVEINSRTSEEPRKESIVSTPTKRKIAEGVMLRKQNISMNVAGSPARPARALPTSALVSTDDFEADKQQEYRRRVLDMLGGSDGDAESEDGNIVATTTSTASSVASTLTSTVSTTSSLSMTNVSSASAASNINASLASLDKLVNSTKPAMPGIKPSPSVTITGSAQTPNSLSQLLKSDDKTAIGPSPLTLTGKPMASPSSEQANVSPASTEASQSVTAVSQAVSSSSGFQVNFASKVVSASPPCSFGSTALTTTASSVGNPTAVPPPTLGSNFTASGSNATAKGDIGNVPALPPLQETKPGDNVASLPQGLSFSSRVNTVQAQTTVATISPSQGGFNFSTSDPTQTSSVTKPSISVPSFSSFGGDTNAVAPAGVSKAPAGVPATISGFSFGTSASAATSVVNSGLSAPGLTSGIFSADAGKPPSLGSSAVSLPTAQGTSLPACATSAPSIAFGGFSGGTTLNQKPNVSSSTLPTGFGGITPQMSVAQSTFTGFGATVGATQVSSAPSNALTGFGGSNQAPVPQNSNPTGFGSGVSTMPVAPNTAPTVVGSFGATISSSAVVPQATSMTASGIFSFSAASTSAAVSAPGNASVFSIGSNTMAQTATTSTTNTFGATTSAAFNFTGNSSSAGQSKPFTFGAAASATSSNPSTTPFGTAALGSSNGFGVSQAQGATFGSTVSSTGLGSAIAPGFGAATTSDKSGFGSFSAKGSSPFVFGATSAPVTTSNLTSPTGFGTFGNAQPSTGTSSFGTLQPAFGGTPSASTTASGFGNMAASGFTTPQKPSIFGASTMTSTSQPSAFGTGTSATPAFGNSSATTQSASSTPFVFGSGSQSQSSGSTQPFSFSAAAPSATQQPSAPFGSSTGAATPFGQPSGSMFGSAAVNKPPAFGASSSAPAFGASSNTSAGPGNPPAFGSTAMNAPAFGSSASSTTPGFGSSLSNAPAFGSTNGFGSSSVFNSQAANQAASLSTTGGAANAFGGGSVFGAADKPNSFGARASAAGSAAPTFNFTAGQSQPQTNNAFGAQPSATGSAFAFGQPQASGGAFNFTATQPAARPSFPTPAPSQGFNFAAAAGGAPSFNFGANAPSANMFTPQPGSVPRPRAAATRRLGNRKGGRR